MQQIDVFKLFGKGQTANQTKGTNCVLYTRVSTKEQADNNMSLETQRKACNQYAVKHKLTIVANFGGTHESASTDERKEFTNMLSFVRKSREPISYIIVYSLDRFSRNSNSIWLSNQLRKLGIEIVSTTQPINTDTPSGQMQQKLLFIFSEFDQQFRKEKCTAGMKEMLLRGDWCTRPPLGYDSINKNGRRTIIVNAKGKLLRQAFYWKKDEGLTYDAIRERLAKSGITLCKQRVAAVLRNPFYAGFITHNMLEGAVVPGNQEALISKEVFLQVNGLLQENTQGYSVKEENEHLPLKRFIRCEKCGQHLHGYVVKKKNIHYYKCSTIGCNTNRNAHVLNDRFANVLEFFKLDFSDEILRLIKQQSVATFHQYTKEYEDQHDVLQQQYSDLQKKVNRLEERFIEEEITSELFNKYSAKFKEEKEAIELQLSKASEKVSNLDQCISVAIDFAVNLHKRWISGDYHTKQRVQNMLFPEGIYYNRETDQSRTTRVNSVFLYLAYLKQVTSNEKRGIPSLSLDYTALSGSVAGAGLEPTTFGL